MSYTVEQAMRLWRQFEKTDPKHTKPVEFGRKFTSIDAHWQIKRVTEVLGPIGEGWAYLVEHSVLDISPLLKIAVADVRIMWRSSDDGELANTYGPVRGMCELYYQSTRSRKLQFNDDGSPKMEFDDDAGKKAMTDALTKALSHLGVSADVFLGQFDDNKYVAKMQREFDAQRIAEAGLPLNVEAELVKLSKVTTLADLAPLVEKARPTVLAWEKGHQNVYAIRVNEKRIALGGTAPAE